MAVRPITPDLNLLKHARRTVEQILGKNSELKELWDESENPDEWYQVINDLSDRAADNGVADEGSVADCVVAYGSIAYGSVQAHLPSRKRL